MACSEPDGDDNGARMARLEERLNKNWDGMTMGEQLDELTLVFTDIRDEMKVLDARCNNVLERTARIHKKVDNMLVVVRKKRRVRLNQQWQAFTYVSIQDIHHLM